MNRQSQPWLSRLGTQIILFPRRVIMFLIQGYQQVISPLFPSACRFVPTCSQYALEAVERYGVLKGGWLAIKRIAKCHPFHPGGFDPTP